MYPPFTYNSSMIQPYALPCPFCFMFATFYPLNNFEQLLNSLSNCGAHLRVLGLIILHL
jgi:hypothetical protein